MNRHEDTPTGADAAHDDERLGLLADPNALHAPITLDPGADTAALLGFVERMVTIRLAEERIGSMVASGVVRCPCHLAIGQEAVAVGVAASVRSGDRVFGAHRSHAHFLALGGSLHGLFAEVLGKVTGVSRGMGGSMHLLDIEHGLYGTVPIVGATIPIAAGAGLAAKLEARGGIAVSFFGDGATEEGVFHESMNLAATMRLPVLFVCENNLFSSHLHIDLRQPRNSTLRYARAHGVAAARVDGNDAVAVTRAVNDATERMRAEGGPFFLEAVTYRWRGHVGPREDEDVGVKRKEDLHLWKRRDPVRRLVDALVAAGATTPSAHEAMVSRVATEVERAWVRATEDPYPPESALLDWVYADGRREER